jgi:DNA-binding CsgD family transcriptional regulator
MRRGRPPYPDILTPREQEVLALLQQGLSNEEIAERLDISLAGAKFHVSEILSRLGVESRYEAAAWQPAGRGVFGLASIFGIFKKVTAKGALSMATRTVIVIGVVGIVLLAIGVLVMELRGGGSTDSPLAVTDQAESSAAEPTLNLAEADGLLHMALPEPANLPGLGWTIASEDDFSSDELAPAAACDPQRELDASTGETVAKANRSYTPVQSGPSVNIEMAARATIDEAEAFITGARAIPSDVIAACLTENLKRQHLDSTASVTPSTPSAAPPAGGIAISNDGGWTLPDNSRVNVHSEVYIWAQSNVVVKVQVVALQGVDITDLATQIPQLVSDSVDGILSQ